MNWLGSRPPRPYSICGVPCVVELVTDRSGMTRRRLLVAVVFERPGDGLAAERHIDGEGALVTVPARPHPEGEGRLDPVEASRLDDVVRALDDVTPLLEVQALVAEAAIGRASPLPIHPSEIGTTGMSLQRGFRMLISGPGSKAGSKSKGDTTS